MRGPHAGKNRRVTGRRFCDGMVLIAVGEERSPSRELSQPSRQLAFPARDVIGSQLVPADHDDQLGPGWRSAEQPTHERELDGAVHSQKEAALTWLPPPAARYA